MILSKYAKYLELTYKDVLYVLNSFTTVKNEDGTTDVVANDVKSDPFKCRLSVMKADEEDSTNTDLDQEIIKYKVFCSSDIVIEKGDEIEVHRMIEGKVVEVARGVAGTPNKYDLAQEIIIYKKGVA